MTLGMFAIIVLTLVYMSEISFMFRGRADEIAGNLSGGFGVELVSNPNNPASADRLAALRGVTRVAPLGYTTAEFTTANRQRTPWPVTGFGAELAAAPPRPRDCAIAAATRRTGPRGPPWHGIPTSRSSTTSSCRSPGDRPRRLPWSVTGSS
jgi:hypothetical protein